MKTLKLSLALILLSSLFYACEEMTGSVLPSSNGKPGELLVVVDSSYWGSQTGAAIQAVFATEQVGLPQREAKFDIIKIPHHSFASLFHPMRNILLVNIDKKSKPNITVRKDAWASSQLVVSVTAPSDEIAAETIQKNAAALLAYFNDKEIERLQLKYNVNANSRNAKQLEKNHHLKISIDDLYVFAKDTTDFVWLRKEKMVGQHQVSQGILIYTYPYDSDSIFNVHQMVKKRNELTKRYVSGGYPDSYMATYLEYVPIEREINFKGIYVKELRGLWQMEGDFMGGPFVSYSMVDEERNRVICIDGYVFAPKFDKREFVRELEALALTVNF